MRFYPGSLTFLKKELQKPEEEQMVFLVSDFENPYDSNAVALVDSNKRKLGSVSKDVARMLAPKFLEFHSKTSVLAPSDRVNVLTAIRVCPADCFTNKMYNEITFGDANVIRFKAVNLYGRQI